MSDLIQLIAISTLHESPFNPRRTFNDADLAELAESIKHEGVLQPLLVRPRVPPLFEKTDDPHAIAGFEVVFGHRRFRAAQLAGLEAVRCVVRTMTDEEAKRAQIAENLQRKDVHPIEEAEGFQALIDDHGMTADLIAEQVGKSRSYVYGRLKLTALCKEVRDACLKGEVGAEAALLVARLRTDKFQAKALEYIKREWRANLSDGGKASYRAIRDLLNEKFTLDLGKAIFDIEDEMLVPQAGYCLRCPKRTGNAPEFDDVARAGLRNSRADDDDEDDDWSYAAHKGANVCTDPDCFEAKKKAHLKREADKLTAAGKVVLAGNAARSAVSATGDIKGAYVALKDVKAEMKKAPKKGTAAAHDLVEPTVVTIQDPRTGKTFQAVKVADLKAAGVTAPEQPKSHQARFEEQQRKHAEERAKKKAKAQVEWQLRLEVLNRVREAVRTTERGEFDLRMVAAQTFEGSGHHGREVVLGLYGLKSMGGLKNHLASLDVPALTLFLMDCVLCASIRPEEWNPAGGAEALFACAKQYGVDVDQARSEAAAAAKPVTTKAPAPKIAPKKKPAGVKKVPPAKAERVGKAHHPTHGVRPQGDVAGGQADAFADLPLEA